MNPPQHRKLSISEESVKLIVHEALEAKAIPNRRELQLTVGVALLGGQLAAAGLTAWFAPQQVQTALHFVSHLF